MLRRCLPLVICALPLAAQPAPEWQSRVALAVQSAMKTMRTPSVSVAVVQDGKPVFARGFGHARLVPARPATTATRYAIGSISKQFTAAALLLLQEEGKLSLDDKVSKYFPALTRADDINIRQLLSHTSGYPDYAPQDYIIPAWKQPVSTEQILQTWATKPLDFEPGARWQYSNTGYVLAAAIFEKTASQPLPAFLKQRIFRPLDMESAGECVPGPAYATPYTRYALGPARLIQREGSGWYAGAAGLCMTAGDLAKWDAAFLGKRILSPASYEEFTREAKLNNGSGSGYALGLFVHRQGDELIIDHTGEVSGFLASNSVFPARNTAVVVLSNQDCVSLVTPLTREIAALIAEDSDPKAREARGIVEALQTGGIDRAKFTPDANSYFTAAALADCRLSLAPLGKLLSLTPSAESQRGGFTHRPYRAHFERKTVNLNIYVAPDGRYEQFLVTETLTP